jgi:hypothetical protein
MLLLQQDDFHLDFVSYLTFTRGRKVRKSLAIFSGEILKKVIKVRKLIVELCLPQYITTDLNPHSPPKKSLSSVYYASKILSLKAWSNLDLPTP